MANKTCESVAEQIINGGATKELIMNVMRDLYKQAFDRGYALSNADHLKARNSRKRAIAKGFKREKDQIDDVRASKWL